MIVEKPVFISLLHLYSENHYTVETSQIRKKSLLVATKLDYKSFEKRANVGLASDIILSE
jgi:hypothetical protein